MTTGGRALLPTAEARAFPRQRVPLRRRAGLWKRRAWQRGPQRAGQASRCCRRKRGNSVPSSGPSPAPSASAPRWQRGTQTPPRTPPASAPLRRAAANGTGSRESKRAASPATTAPRLRLGAWEASPALQVACQSPPLAAATRRLLRRLRPLLACRRLSRRRPSRQRSAAPPAAPPSRALAAARRTRRCCFPLAPLAAVPSPQSRRGSARGRGPKGTRGSRGGWASP
mmetsp:Transcript_29126/g.52706  ORF Transcript_29126/g.52706 Transcript_29126/m.52706 type:complete len:227 (+) Transcript_29126:293-973(+)